MKAIADSPQCWEFIEMKQNGSHSVLDLFAAKSKAASDALLMPFFNDPSLSPIPAI
jgi:hypothetical protein